jgi:hypothetical protein
MASNPWPPPGHRAAFCTQFLWLLLLLPVLRHFITGARKLRCKFSWLSIVQRAAMACQTFRRQHPVSASGAIALLLIAVRPRWSARSSQKPPRWRMDVSAACVPPTQPNRWSRRKRR